MKYFTVAVILFFSSFAKAGFDTKWESLKVLDNDNSVREALASYGEKCSTLSSYPWLQADLAMGLKVCRVEILEEQGFVEYDGAGPGWWESLGRFKMKLFMCKKQQQIAAEHDLGKCNRIKDLIK